jgi:hypothetical protein
MHSLFVTHVSKSPITVMGWAAIVRTGSSYTCGMTQYPISNHGWVRPAILGTSQFKYGQILSSGFVYLFEDRAAVQAAKRLGLVPPHWVYRPAFAIGVAAYFNSIGQLPAEVACRVGFVPSLHRSEQVAERIVTFLNENPPLRAIVEKFPRLGPSLNPYIGTNSTSN